MNTNVVKSPNNNKKVPILSLDGRDTREQHDKYFIPQIKQLKRVLLEGGGDDLGGQVEVGGEVLNAVVGEEPVAVHPTERLPHITLRFEALHHLYHMQVRDIDVGVLGQVVVFHRTSYPSTNPHPPIKY